MRQNGATMITDINSEDRLVQQIFAEHLHDALGWEGVYAWNQETFGPQKENEGSSLA